MMLLANGLTTAQLFLSEFVRALPAATRHHALPLAIILVYWMVGFAIAHAVELPAGATITAYLPTYMEKMPVMIVLLIVGRGFQIVMFERPHRPLTQLVRELRTTLATPQRMAHALPLLLGMLVFGGTFTVIKTSIPLLTSYNWDVTFEQWDLWLHGGLAPWQIIHPLVGLPFVTKAIDEIYGSWFMVLSFIWVWQAFNQRDNRLRLQFFLTLMLGWIILGNIAATFLASAGPVYYGRISGLSDPFLPLTAYLNDANETYPIIALLAQQYLWDNFLMREFALGAGISAMPSMHVAIATLFALVCWRTKRWVGVLMTVYAMLIMIGSVHLGWHYAIDGYVGALGMIAIWWIVGAVLARRAEKMPGGLVAGPA
ncbi:phosphatase PAP2 family protein [Dongia deserti]|uniref:phosphatase PAP2 family protein n=1 Tax=Dongia deserti TaxID=2268030 RepID=UPI000E64B91F|nr:phosphatase PAP2 family protein [Dongia deserti]